MLYFRRLLSPDAPATGTVSLTFAERTKTRLRLQVNGGTEAALLLPRGTVLRHGDKLAGDDGSAIEILAAPERLSVIMTDSALLLTRAAYHLGNRHVPLQITAGRLAYEHDHVLDDLARKLGLKVDVLFGPFEPEAGSYQTSHAPTNHHHDEHQDEGPADHHHPHP